MSTKYLEPEQPAAPAPEPAPAVEQPAPAEPEPQPTPVVEEPAPAPEPAPKPPEESKAAPAASPDASKIRLLEIEKRSIVKTLANPKVQGSALEEKYAVKLDEINKKLNELRQA